MSTIVVTPPAPILDAATVRKRLGITKASEDDNLTAYIAAATALLDGPEGWLGRALGPQMLRTSGSNFPWFCGYGYSGYMGYSDAYPGAQYLAYEAVKLPCPPIVSISSITYVDKDGVTQTLDSSAYRLSLPRTLYPVYGTFWPSARVDPDSVQITYVAGYPGDVPPPIIQAIVMGVAKLRSMSVEDILLKSDTVIGVQSRSWETSADVGATYDKAASALLAPYRVIDPA